jgi:DNA polymerase/3'-5' exonuclease PolX
VVSHYLGGPNTPDNLVLCCFKCNRLKHDLPLKKFVELLEAQGLNPKKVYKRIKAQTDKPIDLAAGKAAILAQGRKLNGYKNGGR